MLVLTRKLGESIVVPESGLTITVLSVTRNKVRLGFAGAPDLAIHRQEVWERLRLVTEEGDAAGAVHAELSVR